MKAFPLFALLTAPAFAETQDDILSAQIRTGWQMKTGGHMAALEMELSPGWKTYWRAPGDAGIPPIFDWSGSENLRSVRVHWPSPVVFHTNGMQTIGYHDAVVLPLEVVAKDPSRPVKLRAEVSMGVCKDICMPASLSLSAVLDGKGAPDPAITRALDARPQTAAEAGLRAISCDVAPISDGLRLTAHIGLPERGGQEVVVVETTDPSVWVAEAESARQGKTLTAVTDLVPGAGAPFALDRAGLTVTVLDNGGRAVEIKGCPAP